MSSDRVSMDSLYNQTSVQFARMMKTAYLNYAVETILDRALPDVRDGLKPVQRRILYTMHDMGLSASSKHRKSARVVGDTMGKYHPHGDASIYDAMVRMAQDFSMRAPLVDGQGNFGSIDGDSAAAMRYTEAKMTALAEELMTDIDADTVAWRENFDNTLREPGYLPAKFPNLLVNGSEGIAVGMACKSPPHNLGEVCSAVVHVAQNWARRADIGVDELLAHIKGPDFPTGGILYRQREENGGVVDMLRQAYETGAGKVTLQGIISGEDYNARPVSDFNDARRLIITEIPYGINKSTLLTQIADGVRAEKLKGISDLRDESDYEGMRIVVTVTRGYKPTKVLEQLLSKTSLKLTYGIIMLALVDGEPEYLSLHRILTLFIKHRLDVIIRRTKHELAQREARLHIVQGLLKALDDIEAVIDTIRRSQSTDTARNNLMKKFDLSEAQANAILNMQLRRLAALERKKLQNERTDLQKRIKYLQALLADEAKRLAVIVEETEDIRQRYATPRQTTLLDLEGENGLVTKADLLRPDEDQMVTASTGGNLSRAEAKGFSWRQSTGVTKRAVDAPLFHLRTAPDAMVILVSNRGRVWYGPVYRIPESTTYAEFGLKEGETIIAADVMTADAYLTLAATNGKVKRTVLSDLGGSEGNWASVMGGLKDSDEVLVAGVTDGSYRVMLFTSHGKAIQFAEEDVNPQASRSAQGVAAISKPKKARLVAGALIQTPANPTDEANRYVLIISEKGWAKRVPLSEFPTQGRAGQGVQTIKADSETGQVATATVAEVGAWASVISGQGRRFFDKVETFEERNRPNKGQFLVDFGADDTIVTVVSL